MSHIIAAVEAEFGFTLLTRIRNGVRLTPEGKRILPHIRSLLREETLLLREAAEIRGAATGVVCIGTFTSVATHWLPSMIKEFQQEYPQVEFRLFNGDYHDINQWLNDGTVELGFVSLPTDLRCQFIPLREDELLAILPMGHPLAEAEVCRVEDVAAQPFISLLKSSDHDARRALEQAGVKPNVKFTTKDDYAIIAMVSQGLGVSIMPKLLLRGHEENIEIRRLDPPTHRTLALAIPAGDRTGPAARRFAEFAVTWVMEH